MLTHVYCDELVLKKKSSPQRKALQRPVSPAPLVSHPPPLPLERGDGEEEERGGERQDQRGADLGAAWEKDGFRQKATKLSNDRNISEKLCKYSLILNTVKNTQM